jgi:glycosyltransferase involved in cell wall biosynthesis
MEKQIPNTQASVNQVTDQRSQDGRAAAHTPKAPETDANAEKERPVLSFLLRKCFGFQSDHYQPEIGSNDDLRARIDRAQLEKTELEKREITLRIEDSLNWKRKWAQTAISLFVPIATAAIALLAAYVELRSVRDAREQLAMEKERFEKLKAADYAATQVTRAIGMLARSPNTPAPGHAAVLDALQNLMLSGTKLPEASVEVVFPFLLDPDPRIEETTRSILDNTGSSTYARLVATALLTAPPPTTNYKLARLLMTSQFGPQSLSYIVPLAKSNDSVVAGHAIRTLARDSNVSLDLLMHLDDGASKYERTTYFITSLLTQDKDARRNSLKYLADKLLGSKSFGTSSEEFYSACAVNQQGDLYDKSFFERGDITSANKLLLGVTLPKSMRTPAVAIAQATFRDVKETAKLVRSDISIDLVSSALGIAKPAFTINDFDQYSREDLLAIEPYVNFDNVPHESLLKLRNELKSSRSYADTDEIDNTIIKQDYYDVKAIERDGVSNNRYMLFVSQSHERQHVDMAFEAFRMLLHNKDEVRRSEVVKLAVRFVEAGKSKDLFDEILVADPFEFMGDLEIIANVDRAFVVGVLQKKLQYKELTPLQVFLFAIKAGVEANFSALAQDAFDEQLRNIGSIEQSELRERPDYKEGDVDLALIILSYTADSQNFKHDVERLKAAIEALGLVPARGLGVQIDVSNGFYGLRDKDSYAKLAGILLPDVFTEIKGIGCDNNVYENLIGTDQLKELVWSAILD